VILGAVLRSRSVVVDGTEVVERKGAEMSDDYRPGEALDLAGATDGYSPVAPLSPRARKAFRNLGFDV